MSDLKVILVTLCLFLFMGACATPTTKGVQVSDALVEIEAKKQREIALQDQREDISHLRRVAYPILTAGVPFCEEKTEPSIGIYFTNKYAFPEDFQDAAVSLYGMGESLRITQVIPGSPAELAGLQHDDVLIAVNGEDIPVGKNALIDATKLIKKHLTTWSRASITVFREGTEKHFTVIPVTVCDYPVVLGTSDQVNAYADGKKVVITKGLIRFVENDEELAMVISHELAHNAMSHIRAQQQNYLLGSLFDVIAAVYGVNTQGVFGKFAAQKYSKEFEAESDYVSLYIMARAGMDIDNTPMFWRRMAAVHPGGIKRAYLSSHPSTPERFVALEKTVEEIRRKKAARLPLEPEYKNSSTTPDGDD